MAEVVIPRELFQAIPEGIQRLRIYEMPISYYGRSCAEGKKISWKHGFGALWTIPKYRFAD